MTDTTPVEELEGRELDEAVEREVFGVVDHDRLGSFRPSERLVEAWEVRDEMLSLGWTVLVSNVPPGAAKEHVIMRKEGREVDDMAHTAPPAISRCALKASRATREIDDG